MKHLILFSHQLHTSYINNVQPDKITILLTRQQFTFVPYHQFRILYHQSAAFHFAKEQGLEYVYLTSWSDYFDTLENKEIVHYYEPTDIWMKKQVEDATSHLTVQAHKDLNFYFPDIKQEFSTSPYKLDSLYRTWRKDLNILMEDGKPIGGKYSFDASNRNAPPKILEVPPPVSFKMDSITKELYQTIQQEFPGNPSSHKEFMYPVTREDALELLEHFILYRLPHFGTYQDAMMEQEPFMVHSLLSASINLGLLLAKEVVDQVINAYKHGLAPIEAVEGFVRQVLGWREYIRGVYLLEMKIDYGNSNHLNNRISIPSMYYDSNTSLHCLHTTIKETIDHAYNHHIQRLMILGNIANLIGISPQDMRTWFNEMYIDSFDWVVTPNVIGMAMYADGGKMSTKPYISSANYINKMSNYCENCEYDPKIKEGPKACPINALYYTFLERHQGSLESNPRMGFMYRNYHRLEDTQMQEYQQITKRFFQTEDIK